MIKGPTARHDARLRSLRYYDLLVHVFVVILLISNLVGQKICVIPFIHLFGHVPRVSGAQLLFPITYIFGDTFTEVYGYRASRRAIWTGFFSNNCWRSWAYSSFGSRQRRNGKTRKHSSRYF